MFFVSFQKPERRIKFGVCRTFISAIPRMSALSSYWLLVMWVRNGDASVCGIEASILRAVVGLRECIEKKRGIIHVSV